MVFCGINCCLRQCTLHVQSVKESGKVLVLSDGSLVPFMAASLGAKEVCEWERLSEDIGWGA